MASPKNSIYILLAFFLGCWITVMINKINDAKSNVTKENLLREINRYKEQTAHIRQELELMKNGEKNNINIINNTSSHPVTTTSTTSSSSTSSHRGEVGTLTCNGEEVKSEVIYWRNVPGDITYESPLFPHNHDVELDPNEEKFIFFEYDNGGWNNIRMGVESVLVFAHATGRTLVIPPQQYLYLLSIEHKDKEDEKAHGHMGFEDFFDMELLKTHHGLKIISSEDFLKNYVYNRRIKNLPIPNTPIEQMWGAKFWQYIRKIADATPESSGKMFVFPKSLNDDLKNIKSSPSYTKQEIERYELYRNNRQILTYDEKLQNAKYIFFAGDGNHRILQHFYAFIYFFNPEMEAFSKRLIRDYLRYKDIIQCQGHEIITNLRKISKRLYPENNGNYYALHIRRGDFQFKDVKISAKEILENLVYPNGEPIFKPNSVLYISTDDPDGVCKNCLYNRLPCDSYKSPKPVGCPEDTTWNAFIEAGYKIILLRDFISSGYLQDSNPNHHGMIESIVCSRAEKFAGTFFSTFTGYIHRLRGYHGLGEETYYFNKNRVFSLQSPVNIGNGFSREFRTGWSYDNGELI